MVINMAPEPMPGPAPQVPSPSSRRPNLRNPLPLSAAQEAQVRDLYYKKVRGYCAAEIKGMELDFTVPIQVYIDGHLIPTAFATSILTFSRPLLATTQLLLPLSAAVVCKEHVWNLCLSLAISDIAH